MSPASGAAIGPAAGPHDGLQAEGGAEPLGCDVDATYCRIAHLREVQLAFLNGTRLGIPVSFVIETSHCGAAGGTIFPMGVTQGASWNVSLAHEVGEAIAKEVGTRSQEEVKLHAHEYIFKLQNERTIIAASNDGARKQGAHSDGPYGHS